MYTIAAFYQFADLPDFGAARAPLLEVARANDVKGTILLAAEGVNGTICGTAAGVAAVLAAIRALPGCSGMAHKESFAPEPAFAKLKVRLKKEIVSMGVPEVNPAKDAGVYVPPADWNDLISAGDVAVIDTRNDYEVAIGAFDGAINPHTESFREFPDWLKKFREESGAKRLAMYCTGGIRCEKATAYAKSIGFEEVYHLEGGILKYLETVPDAASKWRGECYVFDDRVSVRHGLEPGDFDKCRACGLPVAPDDKLSPHFVEGVSCAQCWDKYSDERKAGFAERQRQYEFAAKREQ